MRTIIMEIIKFRSLDKVIFRHRVRIAKSAEIRKGIFFRSISWLSWLFPRYVSIAESLLLERGRDERKSVKLVFRQVERTPLSLWPIVTQAQMEALNLFLNNQGDLVMEQFLLFSFNAHCTFSTCQSFLPRSPAVLTITWLNIVRPTIFYS